MPIIQVKMLDFLPIYHSASQCWIDQDVNTAEELEHQSAHVICSVTQVGMLSYYITEAASLVVEIHLIRCYCCLNPVKDFKGGGSHVNFLLREQGANGLLYIFDNRSPSESGSFPSSQGIMSTFCYSCQGVYHTKMVSLKQPILCNILKQKDLQ